MKLLLIGLGGFIGAVSRYLVTGWVHKYFGSELPWGTLVVNVLGSFILGLFITLSINKMAFSVEFRNFIAIGVLGAFTTFSTFSYETVALLQQSLYKEAFFNILLNLVLSIAAAMSGILTAKTV